MHRSIFITVFALGSLLWASGCTHVSAVEREKLAHPTMTAAAIEIGLDGHVRAVSEGAAGGIAGAGGGCGCN
jgi:hypothetical protein